MRTLPRAQFRGGSACLGDPRQEQDTLTAVVLAPADLPLRPNFAATSADADKAPQVKF